MGFSHKDDVTDPGESSFNEVCTKVNGSVFIQEWVRTMTIFGKVQLENAGEIETETNTEIDIGANKERVGMEPYLRGYTFPCYSQSYGFSSSHIWMWELDHKEDWAPKNCCFQISGAREDSCKSLGQQGDHASHS